MTGPSGTAPSAPSEVGLRAVAAVAAGGAVGGAARYGVDLALPSTTAEIPWATLLVNVAGAFALGVLSAVLARRASSGGWLRRFVAVGVLGSFTTFSAVAVEVHQLAAREPLSGVGYLLATLVIGVGAAAAGLELGRRLPGARGGGS